MHVLIEVYLVPGAMADDLLTQETVDDTLAQVMTKEQAEAVGFGGIPEAEGDRRFIVVAKRDELRIMAALEAHDGVAQFRSHEINI